MKNHVHIYLTEAIVLPVNAGAYEDDNIDAHTGHTMEFYRLICLARIALH